MLPAAPALAAADVRAKVVLIAVPDLRWADLADMPTVRRLAAASAVAELSVKTASGTPRCPDGSVTFSAGNRANASDATTDCAIEPALLAEIRAEAAMSKFGAHVGAFGQALRRAGLRTAAVGRDAVPLVADARGRVDAVASSMAQALRSADVVATVVDPLYYAVGDVRYVAAQLADRRIAAQLAAIPPGVPVVLAGTSDGADTRMHLHVLLVHGPAWQHVELRSPSTRPPYVQLRDLAPTMLSIVGVPVPSSMVGAPAYESKRAAALPSTYADDDDHAVTARAVGQLVRLVVTEIALLVVLLLVAGHALPARWVPPRWAARSAVVARWIGAAVVGVPVCSFLVQVLPWWRWPTWTYPLLVAAGSLAIGAVVALARRRSTALALAAGAVATAAILVADQFAGAPLQLSAPMGDNPIVAGRFHGMGNTDFALMCTAMVLLAGLAAGRLQARGRTTAALLAAAGICVFATVVDAAPPLGDDFGGVLTMGPVTAVLLLLLARVRLTWRRVLLVAAGAVALAVAVALLDYSRPADQQTHVGRFVGQVLHGGAGQVLQRKLDASLASFGNAAFTIFVAVVVIAVIVFRDRLVAALRGVPGLGPAAGAIAVLAVLGTFLNDSGVVVATAALWLVVLGVAGAAVCTGDPAAEDNERVPASSGRSRA